MAHVDFKITTWEKVEIEDHFLNEVTDKIKSGEINSSNDLMEFLNSNGGDGEYQIVAETEEQMTLEENKGYSTIEVYFDTNLFHQNGK